MRERLHFRGVVAIAGSGVIAAAVVAAFAIASDGPGVVHACKQKNNGQVRIVSSPSDCRPSEEYQQLSSGAGAGLEAYAHVQDGVLDVARSKNVVGMTKTTTPFGSVADYVVYCFDLTFVPLNALATAEPEPLNPASDTPAATVAGTTAMAALTCPPGTDAAIRYGLVTNVGTGADSFYARFTI
jgi:hypothetical protein